MESDGRLLFAMKRMPNFFFMLDNIFIVCLNEDQRHSLSSEFLKFDDSFRFDKNFEDQKFRC